MKEKRRQMLLYLLLIPLLLFVLFPIYWTLCTSLKHEGDISKIPVKYFPSPLTFQNYVTSWNQVGFSKYFVNSLIVSICSVAAIVLIAIMVGYALSRYEFKGKGAFMLALLSTQFVPVAVLLIPLFNIFNGLQLIGTRSSIILANITFQLPFNSILMRGFISNIPIDLEEAASIDGCSRFRGVIKIVLPMLVPGIVATAAFAFIGCWNEFLFSLMFLNDPNKFTVPIGLRFMQGQFDINYGALAAGALIAMSIPVLLFAYLQKHLVQGLTAGAVKG